MLPMLWGFLKWVMIELKNGTVKSLQVEKQRMAKKSWSKGVHTFFYFISNLNVLHTCSNLHIVIYLQFELSTRVHEDLTSRSTTGKYCKITYIHSKQHNDLYCIYYFVEHVLYFSLSCFCPSCYTVKHNEPFGGFGIFYVFFVNV